MYEAICTSNLSHLVCIPKHRGVLKMHLILCTLFINTCIEIEYNMVR